MSEYALKDLPAWLGAALDQRVQQVKLATQQMGVTAPITLVFLTEPAEETQEAFDHWNTSCDGCGRHSEEGLFQGHTVFATAARQIVVTFAICRACRERP